MSFERRAGALRLIDWTGERCVPWAHDVPVIYEHFHRYLWAERLVGGRRVLDLGSGEGFGAAILARSAEHVVGLDVDELTVEHSRLNYAGASVEFELGTALDLTAYEDGAFDAVVAFEMIEHVSEQEQVLAEIARVLAEDGILVMSTPDRRMYAQSKDEPNPFHERELAIDEFLELLGRHFSHLASWGQRTITGSHLNHLGELPRKEAAVEASDFFVERAGEEWRLASTPAALYCIALASKSSLPAVPATSTLGDCGLELMRDKERETLMAIHEGEQLGLRLEREKHELFESVELARVEHERTLQSRDIQAQEMREQRDQEALVAAERAERGRQDIERYEQTLVEVRGRLASAEEQLASARLANRRMEESVTWQVFQKGRRRLYGAIGGERSVLARTFGALLRFVGRRVVARPAPSPSLAPAAAAAPAPEEVIQMPEFSNPEVSLVIPVHAHAELTRACLCSIRDLTTQVRYEVILVDDTADVETRRLLEHVRGAKILHNKKNLGFLRSMNRGASVARGQWLVLFNNDTEVRQGWLAAMLRCANSASDIGVVTPKFIYPDGSLNEAGAIVWRDGTAMNYGRGDSPDRFQYEYRRETDYGSAAALMVRAALWNETGGFDERYVPIYYEDADLCFEARERGLRVLYEPEAVVVHIEGATSGTDPGSGAKRFQESNRQKFVAKWRGRLEAEQRYPAPTNVRVAANRHRGQHVLVLDHRVPMPDRDAGSLRMLNIMQGLLSLGARVTFMPDNLARLQPYTRRLQSMGIEVLDGHIDVRAEMAIIGPGLSTAILCRPHTTSRWLDTVREFAPAATVVYDTIDLHWLREARKGASEALTDSLVGSNGSLDPVSISPKARALRELELAMIRATDVTLTVSDGERIQVEQDVPNATVVVVPTVHDAESYVPPPENRAGILFVGGFEHVPNVDAAVRLVKEVMPTVWGELGAVQVTIVGSNAPPEVQALASPLVDVTGWVEDLQPLLERSRLLVAPLRYGAGLKGKVTECLAVGLPVVTTSIGAEGLLSALTGADGINPNEECMLIADTARGMAVETIRVYTDDQLWRRLSRAGQELIAERCSTEVVTRRLSGLLGGGVSSGDEDSAELVVARVSPPPVRSDLR
ncbi:MAG TPA: methyltransferase domain-containing protein [Solirubrobacteraceae bacterium]|jgi:GT2 family glycosyltransferase/SAM-dependent methyltransferase/glycosyltransferase involved in cell wall biosynthesis|nr:methyltransferase domain-containing protein [Solirubrobacteraceae bacterium]